MRPKSEDKCSNNVYPSGRLCIQNVVNVVGEIDHNKVNTVNIVKAKIAKYHLQIQWPHFYDPILNLLLWLC
jgi:hypothetical protein